VKSYHTVNVWKHGLARACDISLKFAGSRICCLAEEDLRGASFRYANLYRIDPRGANLFGAYLTGADLTDANLRSADLRGATLRDAKLV
jgi:uncharacterized protein YjbI with pentapeptide repeats